MVFFLHAVKPTLISKSETVAEMGLRLLSLFLEPPNHEITKEHLIPTLVLGARRHPQLAEQFFRFAVGMSDYSKDLLTLLKAESNETELQNILIMLVKVYKDANQLAKLYELRGLNELINRTIKAL
jgi:hypothetical protein